MRDIVVSSRLTIPAGELGLAFARSGGSGGQNVNKVSSKVELRWNLPSSTALGDDDRRWLLSRLGSRLTQDGTLIVVSQLTRDQIKNRDDAASKLALIVRTALERPKTRRPTKPTRGSQRRRVEGKKHRAEIKANRRYSD
jgi:ribosome-associated protein